MMQDRSLRDSEGLKYLRQRAWTKLPLGMALLQWWVVISTCPLVLALWGRN